MSHNDVVLDNHTYNGAGVINQHILEKAIIKAIANGWRPILPNLGELPGATPAEIADNLVSSNHVYELIFNTRSCFPLALWGAEAKTTDIEGFKGEYHLTGSLHHLQQMVIADDPLQYLKENI